MRLLKTIPEGKVTSYGRLAAMAGNPRGARQVSRILHTQTRKHTLPWFRVLNARGEIAIQDPEGRLQQQARLEAEGVVVSEEGTVDLGIYLWRPGGTEE